MNRQVPNKIQKLRYTIVGNGKVAKHLSHYFSLCGIEFNAWSRSLPISDLKISIQNSNVILLLISDNSIEKFVNENRFLLQKSLVHFSGSLSLDNIIGCHPLMTFSNQLYDLSLYQSIPFVCDEGLNFQNIFPQLDNKWHNINKSDKVFYHAMCVLAGNFTQTLMQKTSNELKNKIGLPEDVLFPYLLLNVKNFIAHPNDSETGPFERGDFSTIEKHLKTLKHHPLGHLYQSFIDLKSKVKAKKLEIAQ